VIAYADGAPEVSAYAEGFQTSAGGPGVPSPGNGGIFNAGAAVSASTYPATRAELEIPTGVGPSTNPSPGGANNFNGVTAQQAAPGTPAATPTESNASASAGQREGETPTGGGTPAAGSPAKPAATIADQQPGTGGSGPAIQSKPSVETSHSGDTVLITQDLDTGELIITIIPNVGEYYTPVEFNGKTFEFLMPAQGANGLDFTVANQIAKEIFDKEFPGHSKLGATWHHVDFDEKTGTFLMQLVNRAEHAADSHSGGAAKFRNWVADQIAKGNLDDLTPQMKNAIAHGLTHDSKGTFAAALKRAGVDVTKNGTTLELKKGGKILGEVLQSKGAGRKIVGTFFSVAGKRIAFVITVGSSLLVAGETFANGGDETDVAVALLKDEFQGEKDVLTLVFVSAADAVATRTMRIEGHLLKRFKGLTPDEQRRIIEIYRSNPTSEEAMGAIAKEFGKQGPTGFITWIGELFQAFDDGAKGIYD
jgi:hypothetical protein